MFAIIFGFILFDIVRGKMRKEQAHMIREVVVHMMPLSKQQDRKLNYSKGKRVATFSIPNFRNRHQMHCFLAPRLLLAIPPPIPLSQPRPFLSPIVAYHHDAKSYRNIHKILLPP